MKRIAEILIKAYQALVSFDISRLIKPRIAKQLEHHSVPDGDDESLLACYGNCAEVDEEDGMSVLERVYV